MHWAVQSGMPLLAAVQWLPLIGLGAVLLLRRSRAVSLAGFVFALAELLLVLALYWRFDPQQPAMQFAERLALGPLVYHAAADGVTVVFMLLTAVITVLVVVYGTILEHEPRGRFLAAVLALEAVAQGMFATLNLLWFVALSGVELMLVAYLLGQWSTSPARELAIHRYQQFMGIGLLLLVTGALLLGWNHADATGGRWTFDLHELLQVPVAPPIRALLFFLLFYGLGIRVPLFPLHGWLPLTLEHGTVAVAPVFLLGLKVGIYGLLRFVFPLLPDTVLFWQPIVVAFAVTGIFYAASLALLQTNLRRLLAYAVVSHTSILVIGLFSLSLPAFQSSVMLSVVFGLAIAGLFFMTGLVMRRTHTMVLARLGGLVDRIPALGAAFLVAGLSIVGMPGTPGFDAAHLMLEAAIERFGGLVTVAAALGNVAAAAFLLFAFQRAFLAPAPQGVAPQAGVEPTTRLEWVLAGLVIAILLGTGFYSEPWMRLTATSLEGLSALYTHP
jgi:NADH-quinone oxidoreductase subunit M